MSDQSCALHEVELLRRALREPALYGREVVETGAQSICRTVDGGMLPHRAADIVGSNLRGATIEERGHLPRPRAWRALETFNGQQIARDSFSEHESLEQ